MDERSLPVAAVRSIGPDAIAIDIETPPEFDAQPGQFVKVTLPGDDESRFYTISSPDVAGTFEMTVVIAGGPGVGPAVGIAERALQDGNEAAVVYQDDDPIHVERLDALEADGAFVSLLAGDEDMTDAVAEAVADGGQVFVYGFAEFLDAATAALEAAGVDADDAKVENFG
jgi:3-phenylpropionate/trans-cinnamate dioxygenase ferredoxin reductase subunit